jgi:hypothetical protein
MYGEVEIFASWTELSGQYDAAEVSPEERASENG